MIIFFRTKYTAVTICNSNQAQKSVVSQIPRSSEEYSVLQSICRHRVDESVYNSIPGAWETYRSVLKQVSLPCDQSKINCFIFKTYIFMFTHTNHMVVEIKVLVSCRYGGLNLPCMNLFNQILTDGKCQVVSFIFNNKQC